VAHEDRTDRGTHSSDALICTVGLSPTPVALSVLTLEPERLILVCTPSTSGVAAAVEQLVAERDEFRDTPTSVRIVEIPESAARDLRGIHGFLGTEQIDSGSPRAGTVAAALRELGAIRPMLDYTGGTSVMVAGCVEFHRRLLESEGVDEPGILHRRSYVAIANDVMRFDDGASVLLDDSLSLSERARLHGMELSGWRRGFVNSAHLREWGRTLAAAHREATSASSATPAIRWLRDFEAQGPFRWSSETRTASALFESKTRAGEVPSLDSLDGALTEALAMILVEHALTLVPGVRSRETWANTKAYRVGAKQESVEFDLLVRIGNTIIAVEAKRSASDSDRVQTALYRLMRSTPLVFGASIRILLLPLLHTKTELIDGLRRSAALLGVPERAVGAVLDHDAAPTLRDALTDLRRRDHRKALVAQFESWMPARRRPAADTDAPEPAGTPETPPPAAPVPLDMTRDVTLTISGIGGSPLAVEVASLALPAGERLTVVGSETLLDTVSTHAPISPVVSRFDPQSSVEARQILSRVAGGHPTVRFVITPGTKAVTAAMVDLAAVLQRHGRDVDLMHIDSEHDTATTRRGADLTWRGDRSIDWPHVLSVQARRLISRTDVDLRYLLAEDGDDRSEALQPLPHELRIAARAARSMGISVAALADPTVAEAAGGLLIPSLALLGDRRVVAVSHVKRLKTSTNLTEDMIAFRLESQAILHQLQHGPAVRTLILARETPKFLRTVKRVLRTWRGAPLFVGLFPNASPITGVMLQSWTVDGTAIEFEPLGAEEGWSGILDFLSSRADFDE